MKTFADGRFDLLDDPPEEFIQSVRDSYPTEREIDKVLTRKLRNRGSGPYKRISLDEMESRLLDFLKSRLPEGSFDVSDVRWFTGGVSKIQIGFNLEWTDTSGHQQRDSLVVRMDPNEGSNTTSRRREADLIHLVSDVVPVPKVFALDEDGDYFPQPALIYEYVTGVTKIPGSSTGRISGMGTEFDDQMRNRLADQFIDDLSKIHNIPVEGEGHGSLQTPRVGTTEAAEWLLNQGRRIWEEDRGLDSPIMEIAIRWLETNLPVLDHVSVIHGDYRTGNFLFEPNSGNITSWLDWERGHLGDRHRDLVWTSQPAFRTKGEDGREYVAGLIPYDEFYERYEKSSGLRVYPETVQFYKILNAFLVLCSAMGTSYRVSRLGKSHQDIIVARIEGVVPLMLRELRQQLLEVMA